MKNGVAWPGEEEVLRWRQSCRKLKQKWRRRGGPVGELPESVAKVK